MSCGYFQSSATAPGADGVLAGNGPSKGAAGRKSPLLSPCCAQIHRAFAQVIRAFAQVIHSLPTGEPWKAEAPAGRSPSPLPGARAAGRTVQAHDESAARAQGEAGRRRLTASRRCCLTGRARQPGLAARLPVTPPQRRNHDLKGLPVHRGVLVAGCPARSGRQNASRGFPASGLCLQALRRPAFLHRVVACRRVKPRSHEGFLQLGGRRAGLLAVAAVPAMSWLQQCCGYLPLPAGHQPRHAGPPTGAVPRGLAAPHPATRGYEAPSS
jgi:hypothetical protein